MRTVRQITHGFGRSKVFLHRIGKVLLISSKIASLNLIIIDGPGGQRVIWGSILFLNDIIRVLLDHILLLCLVLQFILLINNLSRIIDLIIFYTLRLQILWTAIARLIKIELMFLGVLPQLVLLVMVFVPIRVLWLCILFIAFCRFSTLIKILLVHWVLHTGRLDLFATASWVCAILAWRTSADGCAASEWTWLGSCLILLFLKPIKSSAF